MAIDSYNNSLKPDTVYTVEKKTTNIAADVWSDYGQEQWRLTTGISLQSKAPVLKQHLSWNSGKPHGAKCTQ